MPRNHDAAASAAPPTRPIQSISRKRPKPLISFCPHPGQAAWLLAHEEHDVTSLAQAADATVASVSQHLAKLKLADLVTARPEGRRQIYRIEDAHILTLVTQAVEHHVELRAAQL